MGCLCNDHGLKTILSPGVAAGSCIQRKTSEYLNIDNHMEIAGYLCKKQILLEIEVDDQYMDPQFYAAIACDIYKHLHSSEVAEEYRPAPYTLYLTINYIDQYPSSDATNRKPLQLPRVACLMIAAKYEEICAPQVKDFCYVSDSTYTKEKAVEMEAKLLNYLKFELTTPTTKYNPSLIAASSVFLAKYILSPSQKPWNSTLLHCTLYDPCDLHDCVKALHQLCLNSSLPAIRENCSHHKVPCVTTISAQAKTGYATNFSSTNVAASLPQILNSVVPSKTPLPRSDVVVPKPSCTVIPAAPSKMDVSLSLSDADLVFMDDSMPTCESLKSPEVEYLDESDVATISSINRKTSENLNIDHHVEIQGNLCKREILSEMEIGEVVDVHDQYMDPQFSTTIACEIYKHLRATEIFKQPSTDFIEKIQKDINASMRGILVDCLVKIVEEYRFLTGFVPDTLYLTINYIDRYLSSNAVNQQELQLLGVACLLIAGKYVSRSILCAAEFGYMYDDPTFDKEEVLEMEAKVLNSLKFELTTPTIKCFLRLFVRAAQVMSEVPSMQLECMSNYVAELSLLEYSMLQYNPSVIAASSVFLAKYILSPSQKPWNSTLLHYTLYDPCDLHDCVKALHQLCLNSSLPAIREKYSQHEYKFVAKKYCPPSIPSEYFHKTGT